MTESKRELLKRALCEVEEARIQRYMEFSDDSVDFSEKFIRKMDKLLKRVERPYWSFYNTSLKRTVIAAIIAILLITATMSVSAIREPIKRFFVNFYETYLNLSYEKDEETNNEQTIEADTKFTVTWMPDGYEEIERYEGSQITKIVWKKGERTIKISRMIADFSTVITLDKEHGDYSVRNINGIEVHCVKDKEGINYSWLSENYSYRLSCSAGESDEDIRKIILNVQDNNKM